SDDLFDHTLVSVSVTGSTGSSSPAKGLAHTDAESVCAFTSTLRP
ncbi:unnamed protein product, partial [Schistosoma curassoni]|uniref:DUF3558 domain-containing protein n=1 Tax=Schistosoma curassoni TaxID=6186 RepID=A0A183KG46_9TREM